MDTFIITVIVLFVLDALCKISYLKRGGYMRTPTHIAFDLFGNACLAGWGLYLLGAQ